MIKKPTVFVLGAGASIHLGYPLGISLLKEIIEKLGNQGSNEFEILKQLGYEKSLINHFISELRHSGITSVDSFLEHRPEYIDIGKTVIAQALLPKENMDRLFPIGNLTWHHYLFEKHMKLKCSFEEFGENQVSFITFNYDRSLEQFLFTALTHTYGKKVEQVAEKLKAINIVHVHGVLGYLDWQDSKKGRSYNSSSGPEQLKAAASMIRIIHEDTENDEILKKAQNLLGQADLVCFLGFFFILDC